MVWGILPDSDSDFDSGFHLSAGLADFAVLAVLAGPADFAGRGPWQAKEPPRGSERGRIGANSIQKSW